jgi:phosphonate transport system permease protein
MAASSTRAVPVGQRPAATRDRLLQPHPHIGPKEIALTLGLIALYAWGVAGTNASPQELVAGIPNIWNFLVRLFPPEWVMTDEAVGIGPWTWGTVSVSEVVPALIETVQMALIGTTLAIVLSLPFSVLAARNVAPHRLVYQGMRLLLNVNRAIPDIIIALVFVAAVGLGPFSGVLAIAIGSIGTTAKLYAEAIEAIDPAQVQAVRATGAGRVQTFVYGVAPQALPLMASYSLLLFEGNVRSASILGIVGAGGVGFILSKYMALFKYQELLGALILIVIAVTFIDRVSDAIRRRLV